MPIKNTFELVAGDVIKIANCYFKLVGAAIDYPDHNGQKVRVWETTCMHFDSAQTVMPVRWANEWKIQGSVFAKWEAIETHALQIAMPSIRWN